MRPLPWAARLGGMRLLVVWSFASFSCVSSQSSFTQSLNGNCSSTDRYDTGALDCQYCDANANKVVSDDGQYCSCADGYTEVAGGYDLLDFSCSSCLTNGQAASQDNSRCMYCEASTSYLDTSIGDCICLTSGDVLVETDRAGNWLVNKTCMSCPANTRVLSSDAYTCAECANPNAAMQSDGSCLCNSGYTQAGDDWCVLSTLASPILSSYPISTASSITYTNVISKLYGSSSSQSVTSYTFEQMFLAAASECTNDRNRTACNGLGNMCAITGYDSSHPACAKAYSVVSTASQNNLNSTHGFSAWVTSMPLLSYSPNLNNPDALTYSVKPGEQIRFLLASFSFNGTYLGYEDLNGQLQLCGRNPTALQNWQYAGAGYENNCVVDLSDTVSGVKGTTFYSLFVSNPSLSTIYPVPVKVDGAASDYVGRFFILDVNSSIASADADPTLIQYASDITIDIPIREGSTNKLYVPTISVKYAQRKLSSIQAGGSNAQAAVNFRVSYTKTFDSVWTAGTVCFSLLVVAVVLIWVVRLYVSWKMRARPQCSSGAVLRGLALLVGIASDGLLMLVSVFAIIVLILFKGQSSFYLLLPALGSDKITAFEATIVFAFFGRLMALAVRLWDQLHADVFFFDWEKPKRHSFSTNGDANDAKVAGGGGKKGPGTVSVWRRILVINKYNELQAARLVSVPFALFVILFLLVALKLGNLALDMPSNALYKEGVPIHPYLRFAVVLLAWIVAAGGQLVFQKACRHHYNGDPAVGFSDLLHSANVSCLMLDTTFHGYYIHGKSVHTTADTSLKHLSKQIAHETRALVRERGLLPGKDSFEIFLHPRLRKHYEKIYKRHLRRNLLRSQMARRDVRRAAEAAKAARFGKDKDKNKEKVEEEEARYRDLEEQISDKLMDVSMSFEQFLKDFVMGNDPDFGWKEEMPTFLMRSLGLPPHIQAEKLGVDIECMCCKTSCCGCNCCDADEDSREDDDDDDDSESSNRKPKREMKHRASEDIDGDDDVIDGDITSVFYHDPSRRFTSMFLMGIEIEILTFLLLLNAAMDIAFDNFFASILVVAATNLTIESVRVW
eukprot:CAMPEP_0197521460 /NCGR_PEP_ID=MMETSP1318-20131121/6740_1 /TAXON_ID=552666 /ORGANISM="Partenskyella glossopodia, Strain RCC365" /LENGTH=1070 /DNA_ID=CAMNT_0043073465 /DNA_START=10 /DNA_END=3219 /DNA_ORIENTATION=+